MNQQELDEMKMMLNEDKEIWAKIEGHDGYEISSKGQVRSYWKSARIGWSISPEPRRLLKQKLDGRGYNIVQLHSSTTMLVSRLLAYAFIPNPLNLPFVDHIDRNRLNNNLSNLRWCSQQQNSLNRKQKATNTSGKTGVSQCRNKWLAFWQENKIQKRQSFKTFDEASAHRDKMVQEHYDATFYKDS